MSWSLHAITLVAIFVATVCCMKQLDLVSLLQGSVNFLYFASFFNENSREKWGLPTVWSLSIGSASTTSLVHAATDSTATWFRRVLCKIGQWSIGAGVEMCQACQKYHGDSCRQNKCNHFIIGKSRVFKCLITSTTQPIPLEVANCEDQWLQELGARNLRAAMSTSKWHPTQEQRVSDAGEKRRCEGFCWLGTLLIGDLVTCNNYRHDPAIFWLTSYNTNQ